MEYFKNFNAQVCEKNLPNLKRLNFILKSLHWCFTIFNMRIEM